MSLNSIHPIASAIKRGKQQLVVDELTRMAREMGPGAKLPTSRELAKALNVTAATLARCLERMEVQGTLHCRQGSGIYVGAGVMEKRIGMLFGEDIFSPSSSPFGSLILKHCARRAAKKNERFSFFLDLSPAAEVIDGGTPPAHPELVDAIRDGKLDGVISLARSKIAQEEWLRSKGIPVVVNEYRLDALTPGRTCVLFDYPRLIHLGVERLAKTGCKTVGFFGVVSEHKEMFQKVLRKFDLSTNGNWVICPPIISTPTGEHQEQGRANAKYFLSRCGWNTKSKKLLDGPDGVLIVDDMLARGFLEILTQRGVSIGKDLKVCSHSNKGSNTLSAWKSEITQIQFNPDDMATKLFEMLEALMQGTPYPSPCFISPTIKE